MQHIELSCCLLLALVLSFGLAQPATEAAPEQPAAPVPVVAQPADTTPAPEATVTISPTSWDFGKMVDTTEVIRKSFTIKNNTQETVTLTTMPTSCGCMIAKPIPDVLKPGETSELQTLFVPKGMRGVVQWDIKIVIDPTKQVLIAPMRVEVMLDSLLSEGVVNFKVFKRHEPRNITLWMAWWRDPTFKLLSVTSDRAGFDIKTKELESVEGFYPGPQRGYQIDITSRPDIPYGRNHGKLFLKTNVPGHEDIALNLHAHVIGDVTAAPEYLTFGLLRPGEKKTKQVIISHNELKNLKVLGFKSDIPYVSGELKVVMEDRYYHLSVTCECPADAQPGEFRGQMLVATDCPTHPEVVIYLQGIVKP